MSIQPQRHNLDAIFGSTKYHIDFYQRDYRWQKEHIQSLLDDVFYKFATNYRPDIEFADDPYRYEKYESRVYLRNLANY